MPTIQLRRGTEASIPTLAAGEPGFTTDSFKLFIGDGASNHEIGGGGGISWSKITGNTSATAGNGYAIVSSGNVTLTLPGSPSAGNEVWAVDANEKATTYTLTVARNGNNIESTAADLIINTDGSGFGLVYVDSTVGWKIVTEIAVSDNGSLYSGWITENDVTTNQTPTTSDLGEMYRFTSSTAADRILTLPSVGSGDNGKILWIENNSDYIITIQPSDSDQVWLSGAGYGIELVERAIVCLRYNHSSTTWEIINKSGGMVRLEGLKLFLPCSFQGTYQPASNYGQMPDLANSHRVDTVANMSIGSAQDAKFGMGCAEFNGSTVFMISIDSPDWDVFGSTSDDWTVACWAYFDTTGVGEFLFDNYEDGNNYWAIGRYGGNAIFIQYVSGGTTYINTSGGSVGASSWVHLAGCKIGSEFGLYVDGTQVAYDGAFSADTFTGSLYLGRNGSGSSFHDGRMQDIIIANSNIYNAAPNSTPDDTLSNWNRPFVGVM